MTVVVGVIGGSGGVGASSFAAMLAATAGTSMLVDLDVAGGGIDVLLGIESAVGARWSGLHLAGGRLDPGTLLAGVPRWGRCAVLAADVPELLASSVLQVLDAAIAADCLDCVVIDLPRHDCAGRAAALERCDLLVIVVRADLAGLVAAHAVAAAVAPVPAGLLVRRGVVTAGQAAEVVGVPLLGVLPALGPAPSGLDHANLSRAVQKVASGVLAGLRATASAGAR